MTDVLLIHQAFASPEDAGGTRHYELAHHLVERGDKVTIVASNLSYLTGQSTGGEQRLVAEQWHGGVRVLRAYTFPSLHRSFVWRVVSFLSFMCTSIWAALRAGKVDVVVGTSPPIFQAVSAWVVALVRRRPFLLEIRDLWPEFAIDLGVLRNPVLVGLSRWLERFLYRQASHLLVNSPAYRDYLLNKNIPPDKISLIPNGVDPHMFTPEARGEAVRARWNLDGQFVVTYAGALGLANDIPTIIGAASLLREQTPIHILLVGDGKERHQAELLVRQLSLTNVTFTGSCPKAEMPAILAASDACLATLKDIPLFRTTYPNKVFDYMAAGRPTILAIGGVIKDVVEAAQGGVCVPPGDPQALADAIGSLYHDRELARTMGQTARDYVVANFNRHDQACQFEALIDRLASRSRP